MKWDEIKNQVENNGNVLSVRMELLRDAEGAGKLGPHIVKKIEKSLAGIGLGHVPQDLPLYQDNMVRLFKRGTPVGDVITQVLTPDQPNDIRLREQFGGTGVDYADIVQQIRELVREE